MSFLGEMMVIADSKFSKCKVKKLVSKFTFDFL